jgi:hypothetical protein
MGELLFSIANLGILSWIFMLFLPSLKLTRWLVNYAIFPILISGIYAIGIVYFIVQNGAGFAADFSTYEGVISLLGNKELAVIAWIHILALDQLVGRMIYLENMEKRIIPLWVQSVILFFCLMLGPIGFLLFVMIKGIKRRFN